MTLVLSVPRGGMDVLYIIMRIKAMHFNINIADGLVGDKVIDPMVPDETGLKRKFSHIHT